MNRMVSWSDLTGVIQKNTYVTFNVQHITLQTDVCTIPVVADIKSVSAVSAAETKHVVAPKPDAPKPDAPKPDPMPMPTPRNVIEAVEPKPTPVSKPKPISTGTELPRASKTTVDPVVIGMEQSEPLYNSAPRLTKHQMEITEAQRLEALMNEVYAKESGRSRGWTKTGLEQMLKARCASGGDIKELERARVSFPWKLIRDDKLASAFLDFVCVCKQIRVAVWDTESKIVALYPAADPVSKPVGKTYPLYHVNFNGELMFGGGSDLIKICDSNKFVLMPPLSVLKSLSGLTLDELANVATQLGMSGVEGNKSERVAAFASFKVRSRIM
jgi:hypothetical protein